VSDAATFAARVGAIAMELEVVSVSEPVPSVKRVRLSGAGLENMAPQPGQDMMLTVTSGSRRRYTVRAYDAAEPWVELDFVLHGDGPAARWASAARPGDSVEAIGPRGKVLVDTDARWHLFAGDDTFVPATFAMLESLPADRRALVVLEVEGDEDHQVPSVVGAEVVGGIQWLHRNGADQGTPDLLVSALEGLDLPEGRGRAYLAGELRVVNAMRHVLLDKGMGAESISPKPYWRKGVANQDHGEPQKD
jgi:NADPH-dependent ferric siderophore reductase